MFPLLLFDICDHGFVVSAIVNVAEDSSPVGYSLNKAAHILSTNGGVGNKLSLLNRGIDLKGHSLSPLGIVIKGN